MNKLSALTSLAASLEEPVKIEKKPKEEVNYRISLSPPNQEHFNQPNNRKFFNQSLDATLYSNKGVNESLDATIIGQGGVDATISDDPYNEQAVFDRKGTRIPKNKSGPEQSVRTSLIVESVKSETSQENRTR